MSWRTEWAALSNRIKGLAAAASYLDCSGHQTRNYAALLSRDAHTEVVRAGSEMSDALTSFWFRHRTLLPKDVMKQIITFKAGFDGPLQQDPPRMIAALMLMRSEVDYALGADQIQLQSLTERAFVHLQRSIVADPDVAAKWARAFRQGEVACEKLGAAHLLLHGVWGFKVSAAGERTDLVLGGGINDVTVVERAAEGLVLTEWKKVASSADARRKADAARAQAAKYAEGALAAVELRSTRYVVLVSRDVDEQIDDIQEGAQTYRHVSIRVAPSSPSKSGRRSRKIKA